MRCGTVRSTTERFARRHCREVTETRAPDRPSCVARREGAFEHGPNAQDECIFEVTADDHHTDRKPFLRI